MLKYWAQNRGCSLYRRPFDHEVVKLSIRDKFFSNQCSSGVQLDFHTNFNFFTSTLSFNNEDNCCQFQEFEELIKDMLVKGILSIRFWQVYHEYLRTNNVYARVIFSAFYFFFNCRQLQEFEKSIKDVLLKGILSIRFWQVYHEYLQTNNVYARVIFFVFFFLNLARNLGCSLYTSFYGTLSGDSNANINY